MHNDIEGGSRKERRGKRKLHRSFNSPPLTESSRLQGKRILGYCVHQRGGENPYVKPLFRTTGEGPERFITVWRKGERGKGSSTEIFCADSKKLGTGIGLGTRKKEKERKGKGGSGRRFESTALSSSLSRGETSPEGEKNQSVFRGCKA